MMLVVSFLVTPFVQNSLIHCLLIIFVLSLGNGLNDGEETEIGRYKIGKEEERGRLKNK